MILKLLWAAILILRARGRGAESNLRMRIVLTDVYRGDSVFEQELSYGEVSGDKGENVVLGRAGGREVLILWRHWRL